jgi:GNAT superfamily N-acetyltransferase
MAEEGQDVNVYKEIWMRYSMNQIVGYRRCNYREYSQSKGHFDTSVMPSDMLFYLAEVNGVVVGEVAFSKSPTLAINPTPSSVCIHRIYSYSPGRGIGRRLVHLVEDECRKEGIKAVALQSENHRFWEHLGYKLPAGFAEVKPAIKWLDEDSALSR